MDLPIVSTGLVGILLPYQFNCLSTSCFITERNLETIKAAKLDLTKYWTMEILRVLGLVDDYRAQAKAVRSAANLDSIIVISLSGDGRLLAD
jgi:FAD-dependent monooxygenase